jgi:flagellar biosynthesis protein FlhF
MMRIKSYFVKSVDEAIARARAELGEEALLLSTRKVDAHLDSPAGYDVVFGSADAPAPADAAEAPRTRAAVPGPLETALRREPGRGELNDELERLRAQMDEIHGLLLSSNGAAAIGQRPPELAGVFARLVEAGFDTALANQIVDGVEAATAAETPAPKSRGPVSIGWKSRRLNRKRVYELLRAELSARVKIDPNLGVEGGGGTVVAMVGPGGAGKTTTLMKIAAFQAAPSRPVRLLTVDSSGLASRMQLQFFARKTGIAFTAVEAPEALPALIESARKQEIVLIDTPSCASASDREMLARVFANCAAVDIHMVLPGYMTPGAAREAIRKYQGFRPAKLVVTKRDETTTFGTAVSEGVRAGLSLSLVTDGVSVPDDLHAASVDDLVSIALGPREAQLVCA